MAVLKMQRISICALKKDRKAILERLQRLGVLEVNNVLDEDEAFRKMDTVGQRQNFEKAASSADQALEILNRYVPEKTSMFASLEGKALIGTADEDDLKANRTEYVRIARRIYDLDREHAEETAEIAKLENSIESLKPWMALDVPVKAGGTKRTSLLLGTMPGELDVEGIYRVIAEKAPDVDAVTVDVVCAEPDTVYVAVVCMKEEAQAVEDALRSAGFARPASVWNEAPARQKEMLEAEIETAKERIGEIEKEIGELAEYRAKLKGTADYYRVRADKYEVLGTLPQSGRTFVISGYIPEEKAAALAEELSAKYDCAVDIEELKKGEEAPVMLKNNAFSRNVEGIVASYGLPKKGEIDPTTIMSFFYVFFFGMMLSDAAYGFLVALVCFIAVKKYPRMSEGMAKSLRLFFWCGISTLVWGILFGGYFGNIVDIVSEKFFGVTVSIPAVWFTPLEEPMRLLVYSLLFGVIHLYVGLGIKGYMCLKDKNVTAFVCDVLFWFLMLTGLILMLLPTEIFYSISSMAFSFPAAVNKLAIVMAAGGAIGILLMSGRRKKNKWGIRLALGAYDLYNITSWLSDVLSYSRLLALGLATGVIAQVVNQMGSMLPNNFIGVIAFILIFIVGHALNLAINLLGAYVHTNRLQYVEFFGKFYEGGGRPFNPFKEDTKYVDVKEETAA